MLTPALNDWRSQYQRMLRTHARLANRFVSTVEYDDNLRHFFQDCWHLKEWIKNDPSVRPSIKSKIGRAVHDEECLKITADLANGCKHFELKDKKVGAYVTSISVTVTPEQGAETFHTVTLDDGSIHSGQAVAAKAVAAWQALLEKVRLLPINP